MWAGPHSGNRDVRVNIPAEVSDQDEEDESGGRKKKQRTARPEDEEDESSDEQRGRGGGQTCKSVSESFRSPGIKRKDGSATSQDSWNTFKEACVKNNISTRDEWRKWAGKQSNKKEMEGRGWCLEIKKYFGKSKPVQFWPPWLSFGDLARCVASAQGRVGSTPLRDQVTPPPPPALSALPSHPFTFYIAKR